MRCALVLTCVFALLVLAPAAEAFESLSQARRALGHKQAAERARAAIWIGNQGEAVSRGLAAQLLERTLSDPHPSVRRAGWNAMARLRVRSLWPELRRRLPFEQTPDVMPAAIIALGAGRMPEIDGPIVDAFSDHPSPSIRVAVLTSLTDMGAPQAIVRAREMLALSDTQDPTWAIRAAAMLTVCRAGGIEDGAHAARVYADQKGHRFWFARSAYARLVSVHLPDQVAVLATLVRDEDPRVGVTAATGLARAGHIQTLLGYLRANEARVRAVAAAAVAQARLESAYPRLRRMARHDTSRRVRWTAAKALWHLEDPLGERLVLLAVSSAEPAIWAEAVALLARRTGAAHGRNVSAWREELRRRRS
ncbi:MAG: HEAT repeat domain-containing protein [Planctomycetota bacterium]|nr:HEAT repeat domain-containing protein [Planctomycetota bacterium]